jgi:hypothetical protein
MSSVPSIADPPNDFIIELVIVTLDLSVPKFIASDPFFFF